VRTRRPATAPRRIRLDRIGHEARPPRDRECRSVAATPVSTRLPLIARSSHDSHVDKRFDDCCSGTEAATRRRQPGRPARARRQVSPRSSQGTWYSPKVRICTPSTGRRPDRLGSLPSFAAIAGVAGVLAASLIRHGMQAHRLSLAWTSSHPRRHRPRSWSGRSSTAMSSDLTGRPPSWASRSITWRVLAGIRLTLADAWDDFHN
jgi:hypothetical protein